MQLSAAETRLIENWQRGFPLEGAPFARIAATEGLEEAEVLAILALLQTRGVVARIGAAVRPNTAGASLLAAMAVPPERLDEVAGIVSAEPCVNHNYERAHTLNLWFVVAAPGRDELSRTLARLRSATGLDILELPMERGYYLDLGFPVSGTRADWKPPAEVAASPEATVVAEVDRRLLGALEDGLALVPRPFRSLALAAGMSEAGAIERLQTLVSAGVVSRFGLIVRHRALGICANAMAVWDVPAGEVDEAGCRLARLPAVTLCYRRTRRSPLWPYNLFAMVHGRAEDEVRREVADAALAAGIERHPHAILFSRRCFAQRAARFKAA